MAVEGAWSTARGRVSLTRAAPAQLPAGEKGGKLGHCTSYREVESEPDVVAALRPLLPAAAAHASAGAMVDDGLLRPLLRLHTARESWRGAEEGLVVDLDEADSGWRVGEVELLCDSHADVAAAQRTVEATCDRIVAAAGGGEGGQPPAEGKVSYLLRQRQPRHWERLVGAGVLAAPSSAAQDRG